METRDEKRNKENEEKGRNLFWGLMIMLLVVVFLGLGAYHQRKSGTAAEPNTKATNTNDSVMDTARGNCSVIGYSKTERGTGCIIRYLDKRVATISIMVDKTERENPEKKANELLETVKKIIERKGNKITHTEFITEAERRNNEAMCREYVIVFKPIEPNSSL